MKRQTNSYENYVASAPQDSSVTGQNDQYNGYGASQSSSAGSDGVDESQPGEFVFILGLLITISSKRGKQLFDYLFFSC